MNSQNKKIYPDCPIITRIVEVGGLSKTELIQKLKQNSILMNEYGEKLLTDERFTTSPIKHSLHTVELTVSNLGFPKGTTSSKLYKRAAELGLKLCPIELGPYLRLAFTDQSEEYSENLLKRKQAPLGSITIASEILTENDNFPKGFYLRKINGTLWLRGYIADQLHIWNPHDHFIFCR
ncbi:helicase [Rummeliibacillus sp. POC4]|uniref:helicase n=1 Tax=Rummeliibacillus sp. POC4 TaxID=2305899 RepID=UPI000E670C2B|nr:helicase [Rummeliibacillus sp. POC4]RIJ66945.1 helicase [Rummeliibacillus sp. POC4]